MTLLNIAAALAGVWGYVSLSIGLSLCHIKPDSSNHGWALVRGFASVAFLFVLLSSFVGWQLVSGGTGFLGLLVVMLSVMNGGQPRGISRVFIQADVNKIVDDLIEQNADKAEQTRKNPQNVGWWVGQTMKAADGKARPLYVEQVVRYKLGLPPAPAAVVRPATTDVRTLVENLKRAESDTKPVGSGDLAAG